MERVARTAIIVLFSAFVVATASFAESTHRAVTGVIDLRTYDFENQGPIILRGEWDFYWGVEATEETIIDIGRGDPGVVSVVPSYWSQLTSKHPQISPNGVATYRLSILLPPDAGQLGLKFRNITPNAAVFLNGQRAAEIGRVSANREDSRPGNKSLLVPVVNPGDRLDLIVSISNFHNNKGGLNRPVVLGHFDDVLQTRERYLTLDAFFLGGLFLMGLYQFALFLLNRERKAPLYMALLCLLAFLFSSVKNEMALLTIFPGAEGEWRTKLIFVSLVSAAPAFALYAMSIYPRYFARWFKKALLTISGIFLVVILVTMKSFYTRLIVVMEAVTLVAAIYIIGHLVWGYLRDKDSKILLYLGGLAFLVASIGFSAIENEIFVPIQSVAGSFFVFVLYQAFLQAYLFSGVFHTVDDLSQRKKDLEKRNVELFSLSYIDSLTNVCNRRLMDDYLTSYWRVCALNERPMGMLMIDIDYFKRYNDIYGHRRGDACLVKVSETLRDALKEYNEDFLARYGGEEYAVILTEVDEMRIFRIAESLRKSIEDLRLPHEASRCSEFLTICVGAAVLLPDQETDPETLIDLADKALYRAKESGRNKACIYETPFSGLAPFTQLPS